MKGKVVCDSSLIVKWISAQDELRLEQANQVLNDARENKIELLAPELAKYEVGNALLAGKRIKFTNVKISLATLYSLPIKFIPESSIQAETTYQFGEQSQITYYDASFISLAKQLDATLVTDNPKHQAKVKGVRVINLKDYQ